MPIPPLSIDPPDRPGSTLLRFARETKRPADHGKCELCSLPLAAEHPHMIEVDERRLICACDACALLFDDPGRRYRRVPRHSRYLRDFVLSDAQWDELLIPINVAFFFQSSPIEKMVAMYPSPAGPTESLLPLDAWQSIVAENPVLGTMESDVEALLVNRLGAMRGFEQAEHYLVPIDECYKLVGLIRAHWRGFSGGSEVWPRIAEFFAQLKDRSRTVTAVVRPAEVLQASPTVLETGGSDA